MTEKLDGQKPQKLAEGDYCAHSERLVRPLSAAGPKGEYCLDCGWLIRGNPPDGLRWGGARLSVAEVRSLRATLGLPDLAPLNG